MQNLGIQLFVLSISVGASFPIYVEKTKVGQTDSSGFVLVKKSNGIDLYEKWYNVTTDRMAREVKVVFTINTPIESAAALVGDESKSAQWNKSTSQYKIVPLDDYSWVSYIQYDLPWPVDNQDCVLQHSSTRLVDNNIVIQFRSVDHEIFPVLKNVSRIMDIKGSWIFQQTPEGARVEYSITTVPSPTLPRWLTDPIVRNNLIDTMAEFRNILEALKHK